MKPNPKYKDIEDNMEQGVLFAEGYLGDDQRHLVEIIQEDEDSLVRLGVELGALAKAMRTLNRAGIAGLGDPVEHMGYTVKVDEFMGTFGCPFQDNTKHAKRSATVVKEETGEKMTWTDIGIHLIEKHGFFQGKGSKYRLEPAVLVNFLDILLKDDKNSNLD